VSEVQDPERVRGALWYCGVDRFGELFWPTNEDDLGPCAAGVFAQVVQELAHRKSSFRGSNTSNRSLGASNECGKRLGELQNVQILAPLAFQDGCDHVRHEGATHDGACVILIDFVFHSSS
jgi:hypothetical protein